MDTFGERVKRIILCNELTMTSFAKKLNISQSMVSKICSNRATPSERTIFDICRIFRVNKDWLTEGSGEMYSTTYDTAFTDSTEDWLSLSDRLPPTLQQILADHMDKLASITLQNSENLGSYFDGYLAGHHDGYEMRKKVQEFIDRSREDKK